MIIRARRGGPLRYVNKINKFKINYYVYTNMHYIIYN